MREADLRAFARRDWAMIDAQKARYWAERKSAMTAEEALALGEALRRHAQRLQPTWPDAAERAADLATHRRLAGALRAVVPRVAG